MPAFVPGNIFDELYDEGAWYLVPRPVANVRRRTTRNFRRQGYISQKWAQQNFLKKIRSSNSALQIHK